MKFKEFLININLIKIKDKSVDEIKKFLISINKDTFLSENEKFHFLKKSIKIIKSDLSESKNEEDNKFIKWLDDFAENNNINEKKEEEKKEESEQKQPTMSPLYRQ